MRPHRRQPTRLLHPWDSPARILEWVDISFSNAWKWKVKVKSLSPVRLLATPWTAAYQAPPSMGPSKQEYWSGLPLPSPMANLNNVLKSRDHFANEGAFSQSYGFSSSHIQRWMFNHKKGWRTDAFWLWCWRRLLRVPWTTRRSNQSILKEINSECSLKDWCWNWSSNTLVTWCEETTHWKRPWWWERLTAEGEEGSRGWDVWMTSSTQWTWIWINSRR